MIRLAAPWALAWVLVLLPLAWAWWRAARRPAALVYSDLSAFAGAPHTWRTRLTWLPRALRVAFFLLAAAALARPQAGVREEEVTTRGVDIVFALDRSGSMRALDLRPDRLSSARRTIKDFIAGRPSDRLGLVVFAREAYTACPLTLDHRALSDIVDDVDFARQDDDGTAIGLGLGAAINRLKASDAKSKVVILVTDGVNNSGTITPLTAAELAKALKVRVYTIGIGTQGYAQIPVPDASGGVRLMPMQVEIDEDTLRAIAGATGGQYWRAQGTAGLQEIFAKIDGLEKTEIKSKRYVSWSDRFEGFLTAAGVLVLLEVLALRFALGRLP